LGHPQKLARIVREGLEQYKVLVTWLKELDASTGTQIAHTGLGTSLRPEDSASGLGRGSVVRSVLESSPHVDLKTRTLVVNSMRSVGLSRGATRKTHSAMGETLMAVGQVCGSLTSSRHCGLIRNKRDVSDALLRGSNALWAAATGNCATNAEMTVRDVRLIQRPRADRKVRRKVEASHQRSWAESWTWKSHQACQHRHGATRGRHRRLGVAWKINLHVGGAKW
jgi:hypothetical protein